MSATARTPEEARDRLAKSTKPVLWKHLLELIDGIGELSKDLGKAIKSQHDRHASLEARVAALEQQLAELKSQQQA